MRNICRLILGPLFGLVAAISPADAAPLDRARFDAVIAEARAYAEERTLLFYCLRQDAEMRALLFVGLQGDLDDGLKKLRAADSDLRQSALLVETVLTRVRFAAPDAKNPALDPQCNRDFVQEIQLLKGAGTPLFMRPALKALGSP